MGESFQPSYFLINQIMIMDFAFLSFSFFVGLLSFFNPCGSAVLVSYLVGYFSKKEMKRDAVKRIFSGISGGFFATLGMLTLFVLLGLILTIFGRGLSLLVPYFVAIMGAILVVIGISILMHKNFFFSIPVRSSVDLSKTTGFYKYGIMYSLASFACNLPLFFTVIFGAISVGTIYDGILSFVTYSVAAGVAMTVVMILIATSKEAVLKFFKKILPYMNILNAVVLILAGIYLIIFQFYYGNIILF